jgi:hypothetical protein
MPNYIVYFEIYGKKLKVKVAAENQNKVKSIIKSNLIIHKVELIADSAIIPDVAVEEFLMGLFGLGGDDKWKK